MKEEHFSDQNNGGETISDLMIFYSWRITFLILLDTYFPSNRQTIRHQNGQSTNETKLSFYFCIESWCKHTIKIACLVVLFLSPPQFFSMSHHKIARSTLSIYRDCMRAAGKWIWGIESFELWRWIIAPNKMISDFLFVRFLPPINRASRWSVKKGSRSQGNNSRWVPPSYAWNWPHKNRRMSRECNDCMFQHLKTKWLLLVEICTPIHFTVHSFLDISTLSLSFFFSFQGLSNYLTVYSLGQLRKKPSVERSKLAQQRALEAQLAGMWGGRFCFPNLYLRGYEF